MPKIIKGYSISALRKARKLFSQNLKESETDDSSDSDESLEYSHIPLKTPIPLLDKLNLDGLEVNQEKMEQLNNQLASIMQQLQTLSENQIHQQQAIANLQLAAAAPAEQQQQPGVQPETNAQAETAPNVELLFKIPDPIKMIPTFDGNAKQLNAWLNTAEETLSAFKPHVSSQQYKMYLTAVLNKIQGRAKDVVCLAGNPDSFENVKEILINALGDRQELSTYKCQLWQFKMTDGMSISKYYNKSKTLTQNIKTLAKQQEKYRKNWEVINDFIEEDALAAFIAGLSEPYFGYAQAARPKDIEDAYAFLCKFRSKERTSQIMAPDRKFHKPREPVNNKNPSTKHQFKPEVNKDEPMDATTTRSRITLNKKMTNNHETITGQEEENLDYFTISEDAKSDVESDDDLDLNFHLDSTDRSPV